MPNCGLPRGFLWFSGPGEGLRVVLLVRPGLGDLGFWAYVVQFIAVALLASVQAMKQRKIPAPIVIVFVDIGLYVAGFFPGLAAPSISQAEERYQTIGLQQRPAMGASSFLIFQQPVRD